MDFIFRREETDNSEVVRCHDFGPQNVKGPNQV